MDDFWKIHVTVVVPRGDVPSLDDAIDLVGDKLAPLAWAGHIKEGEDDV